MAHSSQLNKKVLLYFVKYPEPGRVKTRLARVLGNEEAARNYRELAERNLEILRPLEGSDVSIVVAFDPPEAEREIRSWLSDGPIYLPQKGNGLGERLRLAFERVFDSGAEKGVALGSDTLKLQAEIIERAYRALDDFDLVLGPAKDGGYYLIGLTRPLPELFQNIPWSTPAVCESTLAVAHRLDLSYFFLEELEDLDGIENCRVKEVIK